MDTKTQGSTSPPLQEKIVINNTIPRAIELVMLSLLISLLVYRVVTFKDQDHYFPWLLALLCESWFTFNWILVMNAKWFQCMTKTYPERLVDKVNESEFPAVNIFVTTADPILEPSIITMNTVLSLLAVDYSANKLALYLSDDGCSPLTFYSLIETTKFAKIWVPFCKKYNVQVRAPFRYFSANPPSIDDESLDFQQEWKKMKNEYEILYKKIKNAAQRAFPCDSDSDFGVFANTLRSNHPTIIKVVSENKEGTPNDLPHVIYISREKNPKHHHHYKAGAMNVLARVSGVMTNAPLMLNLDCDMYANNPQVFLHAMCMFFGFKNEEDCGFVQFPQAFYDGLKDDPFGIQLANLFYILNGVASIQGAFYAGSNCFHRRKVIYGSSPNDASKTGSTDNGYLHNNMFGKSTEMRESAIQALSGSNALMENRRIPSTSVEAAIQVASCRYEYGTAWGKQIGWMYGSTAEDILTGISIHGRGWKSVFCVPEPSPFLGCAPVTYPAVLIQQKRWATGLLEVFFTNKNPLLLTFNGKLWFRQALVYMWICFWAVRSVPEICYAVLPAYCIITNSRFLPEISEPAFLIPMGVFVIHTLYGLWEVKQLGVSVRMWWNIQRMGRVNTMTAWLFGYWNVVLKVLGLSRMVFEVTPKDQSSLNRGDIDDANAGRFTYNTSPMIVPGVVILLVNLTALVSGLLGLVNVGSRENWMAVFGLGEVFCSVFVVLCFWEYLKGLFGNGKYGIPSTTILKSGGLALLFVQLWRRSSQWF